MTELTEKVIVKYLSLVSFRFQINWSSVILSTLSWLRKVVTIFYGMFHSQLMWFVVLIIALVIISIVFHISVDSNCIRSLVIGVNTLQSILQNVENKTKEKKQNCSEHHSLHQREKIHLKQLARIWMSFPNYKHNNNGY